MGLLTDSERKEFPIQTHAQDGEDVLSANEVNTDPEYEQINLTLGEQRHLGTDEKSGHEREESFSRSR